MPEQASTYARSGGSSRHPPHTAHAGTQPAIGRVAKGRPSALHAHPQTLCAAGPGACLRYFAEETLSC